MSKKSICLATLALIFTFGQPVFANSSEATQTKPCHCHDHKKILSQLNLTQETKNQNQNNQNTSPKINQRKL